ncbi:MAG: ATP phosphoribosyltransferase regulatory subunit [Alphaproteobacteria bacterium]
MTDSGENRALLPAGLHDLLPPRAAQESATISGIMDTFRACGYEQVKPPLVEFESTLVGNGTNGGGSLAGQMFRMMDPVSQHMMAVRADITLQVARIAEARLHDEPRPLRLSYAGQILRVRGNQLRPERQFAQVGLELVGAADISADVEVISLAADALVAAGVPRPTVDLNSPALVANILAQIDLDEATTADLRAALDRKDEDATGDILRGNGIAFSDAAKALCALIETVGPADDVIGELQALSLPDGAQAEVERLAAVVAGLHAAVPDLPLTLDPVEYRGFEYHTGVSFTLFAEGVRGELGRGGRYITGAGEAATGVSLYMDSILRALPAPAPVDRLYLPHGTPFQAGAEFRDAGWITVAGMAPEGDAAAEANRLGCSHLLVDGTPARADGSDI